MMPVEIRCSGVDQFVSTIRKFTLDLSTERYLIAGPCGVGKTTLGKLVSQTLGVHFIDHDEVKERVKLNPSPCSASRLMLDDCLGGILNLEGHPDAFVFAIGGDSIFRPSADNNDRLVQLLHARDKYGLIVSVLTAERTILKHRFLQTKDRKEGEFLEIWENWKNVEEPNWRRCADCFVETSELILNH
jgi:hypothetical protein